MNVSTSDLALACRIFLQHAYPSGPDSIPVKKRHYVDMNPHRPLSDFLPPSPGAEICQMTVSPQGEIRGFTLRLGCAHFPHLKLKLQIVDHNGSLQPLFAVDTHDAFSTTSTYPPEDHPDAAAWLDLQRSNRELKQTIESEWIAAGLTTFNSLLRSDLAGAAPRG